MLRIVALAVSGVSLLLDIVGLAIPIWLYASIGEDTAKYGLWKYCRDSICIDIPSASSSLKATRAFVILGLLLLAAAIACAVLKMTVLKEQNVLPRVAGALAGAAGLLIIIGCIIFAIKIKKDLPGFDLHAGFGLCIVAAIGGFVAAVLFFIDKQD